jgi:hypothetical protein
MLKAQRLAACVITLGLGNGDAKANQLSCSSPETLVALQQPIDATTAPINAQLSAAPAQAVVQAEQAVARATQQITKLQEQINAGVTAKIVDPNFQSNAKGQLGALRAIGGQDIHPIPGLAKQAAGYQAQLVKDAEKAVENDKLSLTQLQQALPLAQDVLAKAQAAAQVPPQLVSATPENIITPGQTEYQATCKTTLRIHKGDQPLGSMGWAYTVEQTDAGQLIVTVTSLLGMGWQGNSTRAYPVNADTCHI